MFEKILDLIFPRRCAICGEVLDRKNNGICSGCGKKLTLITEPTCNRCGKPIHGREEEYCYDCMKPKTVYYTRGFAVWEYDKYMKNSIAQFKYGGRTEYADFYIKEALYYYGSRLADLGVEAVMPVPLHRDKKKYRGFNQAEILAQKMGEGLNIPTLSDYLIRNKNTKPQKGLDDKERMENLNQAFTVNPDYKKECSKFDAVLLVDDIYTTGTTINECAKVLKDAGVSEIYFLCLCTGRDY